MVDQKTRMANRSLVPLFLIIAGVLVLIANIGWLSWTALLGVVQLWPLILIAIGVDILLGGKYRLAIVLAALVLGAVIYSSRAVLSGSGIAETHQISQSLAGAERAVISLQPTVGELRLTTAPLAEGLITGRVQTGVGERLEQNFQVTGGTAELSLQSFQQERSITVLPGQQRIWDFRVTDAVPLELTIRTGVGRSELDLRQAQLSRLDLRTGVGETVLTLGQAGQYSAQIEAGVGTISITIPAGLAARIIVERGVGAVTVQGNYKVDGDSYQSPDYDTAQSRVDLLVKAGVGAIRVQQR